MKEHLLAEVLANPHDLVPRMVYADYLLEQGDPVGEFIQVQCQLADASNSLSDDERGVLKTREHELFRAHQRLLGGELDRVTRRYSFYGGFPERMELHWNRLLSNWASIASLSPVTHLVLDLARNFGESLEAPSEQQENTIARHAVLRHLRSLTLRQPTPRFLSRLDAQSLHCLRLVNVEANAIRAIARQSYPDLVEFEIEGSVNRSAIERLTNASWFPGLKRMAIADRSLSIRSCEALGASNQLERLEELQIRNTGNRGLDALFGKQQFKGLKKLKLANRLARSGVLRLIVKHGELMQRIESLDLSENDHASGFGAFLDSDACHRLREFRAHGVNVRGEATDRIRNSKHLNNLEELQLSYWSGDDQALGRFVQGSTMTRLKNLWLGAGDISDKGIYALAESSHVAELRYLNLNCQRMTTRGAKALVESRHLRDDCQMALKCSSECQEILRDRFAFPKAETPYLSGFNRETYT